MPLGAECWGSTWPGNEFTDVADLFFAVGRLLLVGYTYVPVISRLLMPSLWWDKLEN